MQFSVGSVLLVSRDRHGNCTFVAEILVAGGHLCNVSCGGSSEGSFAFRADLMSLFKALGCSLDEADSIVRRAELLKQSLLDMPRHAAPFLTPALAEIT